MTCSPMDRLTQTLKLHAPGVTDGMLSIQVFNVMDEFFRRTSAWRFETEIELEADTSEYGVSSPADTAIVRIMGVSHNGVPLAAQGSQTGVLQMSIGTLEPEMTFPDGDASFKPTSSDIVGGVFSYSVYRPNYISITSTPDAESRKYPLNALLALSLDKSCLETDCGDWQIEEWMFDMFFDDWLDGTLGRLFAMPAKPWMSEKLSLYHKKRFRNAMAMRMQEARRGYAFAVPGWQFPRWA